MITQIEIILVFSFVAWLGVILLAWNKGASDFETGEMMARILVLFTLIGFGIAYYF